MNPALTDALVGFFGAIVGSLISGFFVWRQTKTLLNGEARRQEDERELEARSIAAALLWEIDDVYKYFVRDVCRYLRDKNLTQIHFNAKSLAFRSFVVYEATAGSVGIFDPDLVKNIVSWYGTASAYLDTIHDYGQALEQVPLGAPHMYGKALLLQGQIRSGAEALVAPTRGVCESLAVRSRTEYQFDPP